MIGFKLVWLMLVRSILVLKLPKRFPDKTRIQALTATAAAVPAAALSILLLIILVETVVGEYELTSHLALGLVRVIVLVSISAGLIHSIWVLAHAQSARWPRTG